MQNTTDEKAILLLEDGTVFYGKPAGKVGTTTGEICFNTGMTGYQEVFTDPSYYGQILIMTSNHIGNYGAYEGDLESDSIKIAGLVMKKYSREVYSRALAEGSLQGFLEQQELVGICEVDTRAIVRHVRHKGAMNCIISSEEFDLDVLKSKLAEVPSMEGLELASLVSTKEPYFYGKPDAKYKIAVLDLGIKRNILDCFAERDCYMKVFPAKTGYQEMKLWEPDGYFISNGPGDPAPMDYAVETVKEMIVADERVFGICLGHQIIALAMGISTYKLFNGHRGLNHPVKNLVSGKGEITSQNHGFCVNREELEASDDIELTHIHLNDGTAAGLKVKNKKVFSVQYHPESSPGPQDSRYLFDEFLSLIEVREKVV